jgi:hypothetical protein
MVDYSVPAMHHRGLQAGFKLPPRLRQRARARVNRVLAEQLLNAQEVIAFRQPIRAAQGARLDLTAVRPGPRRKWCIGGGHNVRSRKVDVPAGQFLFSQAAELKSCFGTKFGLVALVAWE